VPAAGATGNAVGLGRWWGILVARMDPAVLAHSLVAAHAQRVRELAHLYGVLERAVAAGDADGAAARGAHRAVSARIVEWQRADLEAERRDVVALAAAEREALLLAVSRAIAHGRRHAEGLPPAAPEHAVVRSLQQVEAAFPAALPRAALVRFRRSAARLERLEALRGPAFALGTEARVLLGALESGTGPIPPPDPELHPGDDFRSTFARGLDACAIREPGAAGAADLGLGVSPAVPALLGVTGEDLGELHERWLRTAAPSHPLARYPCVPRGRFCGATSPDDPVRGDLDWAGPVGWAAADEVTALARDLAALAGGQPSFAAELRAASDRVEAAARRGHAVLGLVEVLPPEAEGERQWLVDPHAG
jgi:hypothetical protein